MSLEARTRERIAARNAQRTPRLIRSSAPKPSQQLYGLVVSSESARGIRAHGAAVAAHYQLTLCAGALATVPAYVLSAPDPICAAAYDAALLVGDTHILVEAKTTASPIAREIDSVTATILEMRPARRGPGERPGEELSEFELEYPW